MQELIDDLTKENERMREQLKQAKSGQLQQQQQLASQLQAELSRVKVELVGAQEREGRLRSQLEATALNLEASERSLASLQREHEEAVQELRQELAVVSEELRVTKDKLASAEYERDKAHSAIAMMPSTKVRGFDATDATEGALRSNSEVLAETQPSKRVLSPATPANQGARVVNPNVMGDVVQRDHPQWYRTQCIKIGLIDAITFCDVELVDTPHAAPDANDHLADRDVWFYLKRDEPMLVHEAPPSSLREEDRGKAGQQPKKFQLNDFSSVYSTDAAPNIGADELCFTGHAIRTFARIRAALGVSTSFFKEGISSNTWRESQSPGKSKAQFFYFGNFVIKSLTEQEFKFFREELLRDYAAYVGGNPDTLLPHFFALFSVTWLKHKTATRYVVMNNVFQTQHFISHLYDLKGSTVGRDGTEDSTGEKRTAFGALLLKDNNLPASLIICGPMRRAGLLAQLLSDTAFLQKHRIVDYSLLVGIRARVRMGGPSAAVTAEQSQSTESTKALRSADGGMLSVPIYDGDAKQAREETYYIGIIDILQPYTRGKQIENFAKGLVTDKHKISVVPPEEYAQRLCMLVERITV